MAEQEYLVKGSTLTGVANAIRSKAGITGTFPLSEFASKIESISAGEASVLSGTFKPTSSAIQTITHNLGKTPSGIIIYYPMDNMTMTPSNGLYFAFGTTNTQFGAVYNNKDVFLFGTNSITSSGAMTSFIANANSTTFQVAVFRNATSATTYLVPNMTYHWYVW